MSSFYKRDEELHFILQKLENEHKDDADDIDTLKEIINELSMLLQVKTVDLDESNEQLLEKEEMLKLLETTTGFSRQEDLLKNLSDELINERKKNKSLTEKLQDADEQLQALEVGNTQHEALNKKLVEKDKYIQELFSTLAHERKQKDIVVKQYKEQESKFTTKSAQVTEKEQQFQNILSLYHGEKRKKEEALQGNSDKDGQIQAILASLNTEKEQHAQTTKTLHDQNDIVENLQKRHVNYEETVAKLSSKIQLVQKLSVDIANERRVKETLSHQVKELEQQVLDVPTLKQTIAALELSLAKEQQLSAENNLNNKKSIENLQILIDQAKVEHEQMASQLKLSKNECLSKQQELEIKTQQHMCVSRDYDQKLVVLSNIEKELQDKKEQHEKVLQQLQDATIALELKNNEYNNLLETLASKDSEIEHLKTQHEYTDVVNAMGDGVNEILAEKDAIIHELNNSITKYNIQHQVLSSHLETAQTSNAILSESKENLQSSKDAMQLQIEQQNEKLVQLQKELSEMQNIQVLLEYEKHKCTVAEQKLIDFPALKESLESEKRENIALESQIKELKNTQGRVQQILDVKISQCANLTNTVEQERRRNEELTKKSLEHQQELRKAHETVMTRQRILENSSDPESKDLLIRLQESEDKIVALQSRVNSSDGLGNVRELNIEIIKLKACLAEKDRMISATNKNPFIQHLEGSIKQLKNRIDTLTSELRVKDAEITSLKQRK